ncbi:retron-type reverse transcriptase [Paenibacillus popilliae ATCC 14706]|uniref:Retron-type reverse transcriptase n=2 Tax=Paenibacillus popilliae TaxID=78057 RepID=M9LXI3_PAEPP|nr:retron-type reverse transcriptase [Paenibacillus popilliae ATCC 14706]
MTKKTNWIVDADIAGFFDHVDHNWMMKCLEVRIKDRKLLRLIQRMLKAGIMEEGRSRQTEQGTPQGGIISPVLANIYLHYVLDLWFEKRMKKQYRGQTYMVRYENDFVCCFQTEGEARNFYLQLKDRLKKFNLEVKSMLAQLKAKLVGHYRYYGITDNGPMLSRYGYGTMKLLF